MRSKRAWSGFGRASNRRGKSREQDSTTFRSHAAFFSFLAIGPYHRRLRHRLTYRHSLIANWFFTDGNKGRLPGSVVDWRCGLTPGIHYLLRLVQGEWPPARPVQPLAGATEGTSGACLRVPKEAWGVSSSLHGVRKKLRDAERLSGKSASRPRDQLRSNEAGGLSEAARQISAAHAELESHCPYSGTGRADTLTLPPTT